MDAKKQLTPERLMRFAWGYAPTLIIQAAVRHGIFDRLHLAPATLTELATDAGVSQRGLRAILNALVGLELLKHDAQKYALTEESAAFLVSSRAEYCGLFFHHHTEQLLPQWLQLPEVVRTGRPATATNRQSDGSAYFAAFVEALFPVSYPAAAALARHLQLSAKGPCSVLDIGAGSGVWGIALAEAGPQIRIHAVDFPGVLDVTRRVVERHHLADRLTTSAGDFLGADFAHGHHVATLGHILHSEGVDRNRQLLRKTFAALASGGVIAIQEWVPEDDRTGPAQPLIFAVNMLVNTEHGDTYTFAEISTWLRDAGFVNPRQFSAPGPSPLILADKP